MARQRTALMWGVIWSVFTIQAAGAVFILCAVSRQLHETVTTPGGSSHSCLMDKSGNREGLCVASYVVSGTSLGITACLFLLDLLNRRRTGGCCDRAPLTAIVAALITTAWAFLAVWLAVSAAEVRGLDTRPQWDTSAVRRYRVAVIFFAFLEAVAAVAVALLTMTKLYRPKPVTANDVMLTTTATFVTSDSHDAPPSPQSMETGQVIKAGSLRTPRERLVSVSCDPDVDVEAQRQSLPPAAQARGRA